MALQDTRLGLSDTVLDNEAVNRHRQPRESEFDAHDLAHAYTLPLQRPHWQAGNERFIIRAACALWQDFGNVRSLILYPVQRRPSHSDLLFWIAVNAARE